MLSTSKDPTSATFETGLARSRKTSRVPKHPHPAASKSWTTRLRDNEPDSHRAQSTQDEGTHPNPPVLLTLASGLPMVPEAFPLWFRPHSTGDRVSRCDDEGLSCS